MCLLIHSLTDEHLGCFHLLTIVNSAVMHVHVLVYLFLVFLGVYQGVGLQGPTVSFATSVAK